MRSPKSESQGLRASRANGVNSSPKAKRLETQEPVFPFESEGWKGPASHPTVRQEEILLLSLQLIT